MRIGGGMSGILHLEAPSHGKCMSGRVTWRFKIIGKRKVKVPVCQNRAEVGSVYCGPCGLAAWARVRLAVKKPGRAGA